MLAETAVAIAAVQLAAAIAVHHKACSTVASVTRSRTFLVVYDATAVAVVQLQLLAAVAIAAVASPNDQRLLSG